MPANSLYPNAPIALVLLEVRHPRTEPPVGASLAALKQALSDIVPVQRTEEGFNIDLQTGERTPVVTQKLVSRDLHTAVTFRPDAIVVEATDYQGGWTRFRQVAEDTLAARQDIAPVDGVERIGLRYIDELRVPHSSPVNWGEWVSDSLLGPSEALRPLGLEPEVQQSVVQYRTQQPGITFTLRYGAGRGAIVVSVPTLARLNDPKPDEEFFLIDTDGAWSDARGGIPPLDVESVLQTCDQLHSPIKDLFESLITERLRQEVLHNAG